MSSTTHLRGVTFLTSKEAGRLVGYTSDYVAKLARDGKIISKRDGVQWLVELASLEMFLQAMEVAREERKAKLRVERQREREEYAKRPAAVGYSEVATVPVHIAQATHVAASTAPAQSEWGVIANNAVTPLPSPLAAHAHAALALVPGIALALLITFSGTVAPLAERNTASLIDSVALYTRDWRMFAFLWERKVAQVPRERAHEVAVPAASEHRGIVVLPGDATDATVREVRDSFSDDVRVDVEPDGITGTIVPVFKDEEGDEYRFVIVPVAQSP